MQTKGNLNKVTRSTALKGILFESPKEMQGDKQQCIIGKNRIFQQAVWVGLNTGNKKGD